MAHAIGTRISTYRHSGKGRVRVYAYKSNGIEEEAEEERIDWTRGCVNASTCASMGKGVLGKGNYAHVQRCEKGAESVKGE